MKTLTGDSTALVTGAANPLGRAMVLALVRRGVRVFMVARDWETGFRLRDEARSLAGPENYPELFFAEFSLLGDAAALAERIRSRTDALDAIFHFAGWRPAQDEPATLVDPEPSFIYNVLSPFVLTNALEPLLAAREGRVVSDVSAAWAGGRLDWSSEALASSVSEIDEETTAPEDSQTLLAASAGEADDTEFLPEGPLPDPTVAWADAQAARILWTFALANRWQDRGLGAFAFRPGWLDLDVFPHLVPHEKFGVHLLSIFTPSLEKLTERALRLAESAPLGPAGVWWPAERPHRVARLADPWLQTCLWERLTHWTSSAV